MEVGTVVATEEGPSTSAFSFVINGRVGKNQFVQLPCDAGLLIASVSEITRANRYFERAESVAEYERGGKSVLESFPASEWEYAVAAARALGVYGNGSLLRSVFPPAPGAKVFAADEKVLAEFLGFEKNGLHVGRLQHHDVEARIGMNRLLQKHLAILAMSGAGKSHLAAVLLEELLGRSAGQGRIAVIAIDVHGEYLGFAEGDYAQRVAVVDGRRMRIALPKLSPGELAALMPNLSAAQKRDLSRMMHALREAKEPYGLQELIAAVEADEAMNENSRQALAAWLAELRRERIFGDADAPNVREIARSGRLSVLDLSGIDDLRKKQLLVAHLANRLFKARRKGAIPPFMLLVEEAHNFAREGAARSEAISRSVIEKIAREGRKFGAALCLISQRPVQLSTTALSQCNSHMIMRMTNPYDLDHVAESCEGIDKAAIDAITTLRTGEALVIGEALNHPVFMQVRERKSRGSQKGGSIEALAKQYEQDEEARKKDAKDAFL